jgi:C4-dicarboxylate transporter
MSSKVFCLNLFGIFLIMTVVLSSLSSMILNSSMSFAGCFYKDMFNIYAYLINKRGPSQVGLRTPGF